MREIFLVERTIRETNRIKISREFNVGWSVLARLLREKKLPEGKHSEVYDRLRFLGMQNRIIKTDQNLITRITKNNDSLDEKVEKAVSNLISFEFFTNVIEFIKRWADWQDHNNPREGNRQLDRYADKKME